MAINVKVLAIVAVVAIAVAGVVSVAVYMNDNNSSSPYSDDAAGMAKKISDKYEGVYGKFTVEEGSNAEKAVINSIVEKYQNDKGQQQTNRITIYKLADKDKATAKYNELLVSFPTKVSMYTTIETLELTAENQAADYNCDLGKIMVNTYAKDGVPGTAATQVCGLILHGSYVIDFSQTVAKGADAGENVRLYYGLPVTDKYESDQQMNIDQLHTYVKDFLKVL